MDVSEARRLRTLEEESRPLKTLVADLSLDVRMLQAVKKISLVQLSDVARGCVLVVNSAYASGGLVRLFVSLVAHIVTSLVAYLWKHFARQDVCTCALCRVKVTGVYGMPCVVST